MSAITFPSWVIPSLAALVPVNAKHRSVLVRTISLAYTAYWVLHLVSLRGKLSGNYVTRHSIASNVVVITFRIFNTAVLMSPNVFVRVKSTGQVTAKHPTSLLPKLFDNFEIAFLAIRGVGWKYQVAKVPAGPSPYYPRWKFVLETLAGAAWRFMFIDISWSFMKSTPAGHFPIKLGAYITDGPPLAVFAKGLLNIMQGRCAIELVYCVAAAFFVGIGVYAPSDWPPIMGSPREAYTVRRFWSYTWHQCLRLSLEPPAQFFTHRVLRIRKGTYWSNYVKVFAVFALSGLIHAYGTYVAGGNPKYDMYYFTAQAGAIWLEEHVVRLGRMLGVADGVGKPIGYLWTLLFMGWGWMLWQDSTFVPGGSLTEPPFGYSLADEVLRDWW